MLMDIEDGNAITMKYKSDKASKLVSNGKGYIPSERYDDTTPARTYTNAAQRDRYVPEPDHHYRAGSMDYKKYPSKGLT